MQRQSAVQPIEFKDLISIILAALSVQLTVLGIGFAIIAIYGYGTIKEAAIRAATGIVRTENARAARERRSTAEAEADFNELGAVSQEDVQKLVDALVKNETGTERPPEQPGMTP